MIYTSFIQYSLQKKGSLHQKSQKNETLGNRFTLERVSTPERPTHHRLGP